MYSGPRPPRNRKSHINIYYIILFILYFISACACRDIITLYYIIIYINMHTKLWQWRNRKLAQCPHPANALRIFSPFLLSVFSHQYLFTSDQTMDQKRSGSGVESSLLLLVQEWTSWTVGLSSYDEYRVATSVFNFWNLSVNKWRSLPFLWQPVN